jgi:hypothetical protein
MKFDGLKRRLLGNEIDLSVVANSFINSSLTYCWTNDHPTRHKTRQNADPSHSFGGFRNVTDVSLP